MDSELNELWISKAQTYIYAHTHYFNGHFLR